MKGIIVAIFQPRQSSLVWMSQTSNMSRGTNKVVMMRFKTITAYNQITINLHPVFIGDGLEHRFWCHNNNIVIIVY